MRRPRVGSFWRFLLVLGSIAGACLPVDPVALEIACTLTDTTAASDTCLKCHRFTRCHPYDVDYASLASASRGSLRTAEEVIRLGLFLPEGRMSCHTCHDADSWWSRRLVIPAGSKVTPRVRPEDPSTYDPAIARASPMTVEQARATLPRDTDLSPKPLCLACHARD